MVSKIASSFRILILWLLRSPLGLPLEFQIGLLDLIQREMSGVSRFDFERDHAVGESGQRAFPIAPALHRVAQRDFRFLSLKPLIILRLEKFAFNSGRADLERIPPARH